MQNRQLKRFIYQARYEYMTMNNIVLAIAAVIAISWAWSSVLAVQRNYQLQHDVDDKRRQSQLVALQTQNLQFEQHYYQSTEYLTLEAKRRLGLADQGERVLILPHNSAAVIAADNADQSDPTNFVELPPAPPLQQWIDFLFGEKTNT